jgi:hypothetical protein
LSFVTAGLAFGALLFAVPLIIHLLNRQRFRRREWAAMEFLLRAFKKQRRRLRTENLILLLLRCLIPVLLAFALARPFLDSDLGVIATRGTTHHVLVFDRSYSMGYQPAGSQSPHTKAVRLATRRLEQLDGLAGQKVTLVLAGIRPEIPVRGAIQLANVRARLARMGPPTDSAESLLPALSQVAELLEDEKLKPSDNTAAKTRIYVYTDLQKTCFGDAPNSRSKTLPPGPRDPGGRRPVSPQAPPGGDDADAATRLAKDTILDLVERLSKLATFTVMDMSGAAGTMLDNVQVTGLRLQRAHAVADVPLQATVTVRNLTSTTQNVEVTLEKDIGEPTRRLIRVDAGAEADVPFQVVFRTEGKRQLRASLQTDGLEADNTSYRVVEVKERLKVLMVEGSLEHEFRLMDSGWLRVILDPTLGKGDAAVTEFATKTIDGTAFLLGQENLQDYQMIVLANVKRLTEEIAENLKAAVEAGTGLLIALGPRAVPESYNLHLYGDGLGPMPIRLQRFEGYDPGGARFYRNQVVDVEHPVMRDFKADEPLLQALQLGGIYRYFISERESLGKDGKILWQISNPTLSPLLVAGRYGEGRTLLLTSQITSKPDKWNTLDALVHAVPLFHPMAHWLSHPAHDPYNVRVGSALTAIVRKRPQDLAVVLSERGGGSKVPIAKEGRPLRGGLFALPAFTQTDHAGVYIFEMDLGQAGATEQLRLPFAVNPDPTEGELRYFDHRTLREDFGIKNIYTTQPDEDQAVETGGVGEFAPFLLYLTLLFVLGEASWARFVSRRRM